VGIREIAAETCRLAPPRLDKNEVTSWSPSLEMSENARLWFIQLGDDGINTPIVSVRYINLTLAAQCHCQCPCQYCYHRALNLVTHQSMFPSSRAII